MERVAVAARVSSALQVLVSDDLDGYLLSRRAVGRLATSLCCPMRWFVVKPVTASERLRVHQRIAKIFQAVVVIAM